MKLSLFCPLIDERIHFELLCPLIKKMRIYNFELFCHFLWINGHILYMLSFYPLVISQFASK